MLLIEKIYFSGKPNKRQIAEMAGVTPEYFSRVLKGKQKPSYKSGGSAERIAAALCWAGTPAELFQEVDC